MVYFYYICGYMQYYCIYQLIKILLLGIYLVSFIMIWCAYLHKLPPIGVYVQQSKSSILYTIYVILHTIYDFIMVSYDFIMCEIRDFALFLVKICRIIQKYPPLCRKDFFQKTMVEFCPTGQKISMLGREKTHPLYISYLY